VLCAILNDLDRSSRSFKLFRSENKCIATFPVFDTNYNSLGDLTKDDIADDLE